MKPFLDCIRKPKRYGISLMPARRKNRSHPVKEINGRSYYLMEKDGNIYYRTTEGRMLHRDLYEMFVGPIPAGFDVHHKDGDTTNNHPDNLVAVSKSDHGRIHRPPGSLSSEAAAALGRLGGMSRSARKIAAARANAAKPCAPGKKRGRPRKNPL